MGLPRGLRKYVETKDKRHYNKSEYNRRLINFCQFIFKDFVSIIENMDEDVQAKIFNAENLSPFFEALFSLNAENLSKEDVEKRRKRLLRIANKLLLILSAKTPALAPNAWRYYARLKGQTVDRLSLIWAESLGI